MGLTPFDVSNLNQAMAGLGNTFAERRQEAMQQQKLDIEEDLRQKMLDAEMRRVTAEEGRQNLLSEGHVDTWLQSEDGGLMHFQGPNSGLQKLMDGSAQQGKPLTQTDEPPSTKAPPAYGMYEFDTPVGHVQLHLQTPEQLQNAMQMGAQVGAHARQPGEAGVAGPIQVDKYAAGLQAQRDAMQSQLDAQPEADPVNDPIKRAAIARLDTRIKSLQAPRYDPSQFQSVTTTAPADPTGAHTSITQRVPVGAPLPGQAAAPPAAPLDPKQRVPGQSYTTPKGVVRWSGTGWQQ